MILPPEDARLFYKLMWGVQFFVNQQAGTLKGITSVDTYSLYGAKILSIARNRSGRVPVIIVDDTSQDISSTDRSCCVTYWPGYRKVMT